jgi:hypothetical protein
MGGFPRGTLARFDTEVGDGDVGHGVRGGGVVKPPIESALEQEERR